MGTNLLTFAILERMHVGLYLVLIQHKVLLVVGLSVIVLRRAYSARQWAACLLLMPRPKYNIRSVSAFGAF